MLASVRTILNMDFVQALPNRNLQGQYYWLDGTNDLEYHRTELQKLPQDQIVGFDVFEIEYNDIVGLVPDDYLYLIQLMLQNTIIQMYIYDATNYPIDIDRQQLQTQTPQQLSQALFAQFGANLGALTIQYPASQFPGYIGG